MLKFRMEFALENDAFRNEDGTLNREEVTRLIGDAIFDVSRGFDDAKLIDTNGNTVGQWEISTCSCTSTTDDAFDGVDENCPIHGLDARRGTDAENTADIMRRIKYLRSIGHLACIMCGTDLGEDDEMRDPDCPTCEARRDAEQREIDDDDDGCPKNDPDCTSRADECHDACESPDTSIASALALQPGARVMFVRHVERFPHAFVERGSTGVIVQNDEEMLIVHLDEYHDGLDEWDNCIIWTRDDGDRDEWFAPDGDIAILEAPRRARRVEMIEHPTLGYFITTHVETLTSERRQQIRRAMNDFDDGIYIATDGWMLPSWTEMYVAMRGKAGDFTDDYNLACQLAMEHCADFSTHHIDEIMAGSNKYIRPIITGAMSLRMPF